MTADAFQDLVLPPVARLQAPLVEPNVTSELADRVRHCVQSAFNGKRIVIFSGGEAKGTDEIMEEVKQIAAGGGFGSIMGRNSFQRPRAEAIKLLQSVMQVFKNAG